MSNVAGSVAPGPPSAPRWTPPIPPVAKTRIPAAWAAIIVAETVVADQPSRVSAAERLGRAAFRTDPDGAVASASSAVIVQADEEPAIADRHGGRNGARFAHGRLRRPRDLDVLRVGQAMADQRGLEGHDGPAGRQGRGDLGLDRRGDRRWNRVIRAGAPAWTP